MANTLFDKPLFVKQSRYIQELGSLEDVLDLLESWPEQKRDAAYEVLVKACRLAAQGIFPSSAIRENVRRFLLRHKSLANIDEVPLSKQYGADRNIGS